MTTAEDVHTVSRDFRTYSSERGGITAVSAVFPLELTRAMFIGMDPPKHDRVKALFQAGFTPKRIAAHEDAIRAIVIKVLDRLDGRETCDLVEDVAQPAVARVIGSFMGIPEEDDAIWARLMNSSLGAGDPDLNPDGVRGVVDRDIPEIFERCGRLIAERREQPDRRSDERAGACGGRWRETRGTRDRDGVLPVDGGGQRLDEGNVLQWYARADGGSRADADAGR